MTAFFGTVLILTFLACIPLVFLFAGKNTDRRIKGSETYL